MYKFLLSGDAFFNKLTFCAVIFFIGYMLGGCSPRQHMQPDLSDSVPSNATYQYINMQKFKTHHKAFYSNLR